MKRIIFLICLLLASRVFAYHIVGGEMVYKHVSTQNAMAQYNVKLYLYIDCEEDRSGSLEGDLNSYINIFTYNPVIQDFELYDALPMRDARTGPEKVALLNYKCIKKEPDVCVNKYVYELDVYLPINDLGYLLSFERCCRNTTINNIVNPQSTGATYWTTIPGIKSIPSNSSPTFKGLPPNFLCTNAPLNYDHSAVDIDGDSLVYELFTPFQGATQGRPVLGKFEGTLPSSFTPIIWGSNYSETNQIDGSPSFTINRKTGKLTLTPTVNGQFVIGIKVLEFRKGQLIGETKRDFQFNVITCVFDVVSSFGVAYQNCSGTPVLFQNRSQGASTYMWDFGDNVPNDTTAIKDPSYTYEKPGTYTVKLVAAVNNCIDTSEFDIVVKQNFKTKIDNDTLICGPFTKVLKTSTPNKSYKWSTGETTPSITVNTGGRYIIAVSDLPCISKDTINIINDLSRIDLGPDSVICRDSFVQFTYRGRDGYKSYLWNDGTTLPTVFIPNLNTYRVNVVNNNNCPSSDSITFVLYPPPRVYLNDTLFCKGTTVRLDGVNYSIKTKLETNYTWNSGETTPQIVTGKPGMYIVTVKNKLCTIIDTASIAFIETGLDLGNDTFYCGPVDRWLVPPQNFVTYLWHDFLDAKSYHAITPGKKKLTITTIEGCVESDSVMLIQYPNIDGGLGKDTTICLSSSFYMAASDSMINYLWSTGATSQAITVRDHGMYTVTVKNINGCIVSDSIAIKEDPEALPSELFIPTAFTPDEDGLNDVFPGSSYKDPGSTYHLEIFNRWGEKIFVSNHPSVQWDGTYKGNAASQDVYVFYVRYVACDEQVHWVRGTFTLLR
ncbi:MAG: gliding motility-associated C-terminal domain-containing protein [Bacteroidota bacterium]